MPRKQGRKQGQRQAAPDTALIQPHKLSGADLALAKQALELADASWFALARACAFSSQLEFSHHFYRLPGLHESHTIGFIPGSYHLTSAPGGLRNMVERGKFTVMQAATVKSCLENALPFLASALEHTERLAQVMASADEVSSSSDSDTACDPESGDDVPICVWARRVVSDTRGWTIQADKLAREALDLLHALARSLGVLKELEAETEPRAQRSARFRLRHNLHTSSAIGPQGNGLK